jgi:hypothetical protein
MNHNDLNDLADRIAAIALLAAGVFALCLVLAT